jgi:hypothetical protein
VQLIEATSYNHFEMEESLGKAYAPQWPGRARVRERMNRRTTLLAFAAATTLGWPGIARGADLTPLQLGRDVMVSRKPMRRCSNR